MFPWPHPHFFFNLTPIRGMTILTGLRSTCRFCRYLPSHTVSKGPEQIRSDQVRDAGRQKRHSLFPPPGTHGIHHPYGQRGLEHGDSRVGERYSSCVMYENKMINCYDDSVHSFTFQNSARIIFYL